MNKHVLDDVLAFAGLIFFIIVMGVAIYALGPDVAAWAVT